MNSIRELLKPIANMWSEWSSWQRWSLVVLAVAVTAGLLLWAGVISPGSGMVPLFGRLEARDAGAISAALDEMGVPYGLDDSGRTILVPGNQVERLRLHFAGEGLPAGGVVGFEIMDEAAWVTTEFGRKVSYIRALQGELTRTIKHIDGVSDARVHIVLPQSTLFVREEKVATAAVLLNLRPMFTPEPSQTRSIMHLVAAAVEDLAPENVTVIDDTGRILSAEAALTGAVADRGEQSNAERELEGVLRTRVQALLDQVLGPGNSVVQVRADLNFDEQMFERQTYDTGPDGAGYLRSAYEAEELYSGTSVQPGAAGIDANIPGYYLGGGGDSEYQRSETTFNYELAETRELHVIAPGAVTRLSVAVVVNGEMAEEERLALANMVSAAVGADDVRGDQIVVMGQPFSTDFMDRWDEYIRDEQAAQEAYEEQMRQMIFWGAIGAGALIVLLTIFLIIRRRRLRIAARRTAMLERARQEEVEAAAEADARKDLLVSLDTVPDEENLRKAIEQLARQDPARVANALRVWLAED